MNSYANYIETIIGHEPENKLLEARTLYNQSFSTIPEMTYYKTLERMCKKGFLVHLTKGLYYRPKNTRFGTVPISEKDIVDHYIKDNQGIVVGYRLYNQKGLTTQISKRVEILSSAVPGKKKNIHNVYVMNINISLTPETIPIIETLEILQNYKSIEDINNTAFATYMKEFARQYSDEATVYVLKNRKYKKSTIAFLESFLNHFQVKNSLNQFLSSLSSYNIPDMKEFY
ncbi:DUF6088 family protein [uncultured Catenibacterium sp.]|mgnify:FL=1|uniref:DUF6088 family protein n=1 Tax=uncultured Catenibacterium sp. TaxID=286142 RepID=UPI0025DBAC4B|nr:DUF6088 family protein [uncultured Catenibacterium sp.]